MKRGLIIISSSSLKAKIEIRDVDTMAGKKISRGVFQIVVFMKVFHEENSEKCQSNIMFCNLEADA